MNFLHQYLPEELVNALGRMIFHSFWHGAVISFALSLILFLFSKKDAQTRYLISVSALMVFVVCCIVTFTFEYNSINRVYTTDTITIKGETPSSALFENPISFKNQDGNIWDSLNSYFNQNLQFFVLLWFTGLFVFSLRFIGSVLYVQKVRTHGTNELDVEWIYRSREVGKKLGFKNFIPVFESAKVKVPLAIGYIKPVILLPLGMINNLPYYQVEALLAHEFAHIKRYDFAINLLQTLFETIFFYHPAVWWISNQIREERENCCDDITVSICGNAHTYSKALYNLLHIKHNHPELALAASGNVNQLLRRIKRMNGEYSKLSYGGRFAAFIFIFAAIAAVLVFSAEPISSNTSVVNKASVFDFAGLHGNTNNFFNNGSAPDSSFTKKRKRTLKFTEEVNGDSKVFKAKLNNGKLDELYIDGEKVEAKDYAKYESNVYKRLNEYDSAMSDYKESMKKYHQEMSAHREKLTELRKKLSNLNSLNKHNHDYDFDFPEHISLPHFDSEELRKTLAEVKANLKEQFAKHPIRIPPINIPPIQIPPIPPVNIDGDCDFEFDKEEFEADMKEWEKEFEEGMKVFSEEMKKFDGKKLAEEIKNSINSEEFKESMKDLKKNMGKVKTKLKFLKEYLSEVKDELISDKIVADEAELDKLYISKTEMKANGKSLSPELHKKYLQIYKKHFGKELEDEQKINF